MDPTPTATSPSPAPRRSGGAVRVAAGIFLSRITGLIRDRVFAHYFGNSNAADAFKAAQKIPNFLQNLLGEGVLSASFIPVYARLLNDPEHKDADRVASAIGSLLAVLVSILVAVGIVLTPYFVDLVAPGFEGEKRQLTIRLVQILFPGVGLLVMSAWCLGILNSHRRFFLSYVSPVLSNAAMIAAMIAFGWGRKGGPLSLPETASQAFVESHVAGQSDPFFLIKITAWSLVVGNLLQFAVQVPTVWRLAPRLRPVWDVASGHVRVIIRNFVPVVVARGVVQVSAYIDNVIASFLPMGAVASLAYAQTLYLLPVSLFGMSVSAAELPAMSGVTGNTDDMAAQLRQRLDAGLRHIAFFIIPSVAVFLAFGDVVVGAIYQTGAFGARDTRYVWTILAGSTVGLLAMTLGRLYSSTYYALHDTRTPLNFAMIRVLLTTVLGYLCALHLPRWLGLEPQWGTPGLTASAGAAGWIEFLLLRRALNRRIGRTGLSVAFVGQLWLAALFAAVIASAGRLLGLGPPLLVACVTLVPFGLIYLATTVAMRIPEAQAITRRLRRAA